MNKKMRLSAVVIGGFIFLGSLAFGVTAYGQVSNPVRTLTITMAGIPGKVTITTAGSSEAIVCTTACTKSIPDGAQITLTATPTSPAGGTGPGRISWSGHCGPSNATTCNLTMNGDKRASLVFSPASYSITIMKAPSSGLAHGTVTVTSVSYGGTVTTGRCPSTSSALCQLTVPPGASLTFRADPDSSSRFSAWSAAPGGSEPCDGWDSRTRECSITAIHSNFNLYVYFDKTVTVKKSGGGSGTVVGGQINCGTACSASLEEISNIGLTARPDPGSIFVGWTNCTASANNPLHCSVAANQSNVTVTARFEKATSLLVFSAGTGEGSLTIRYPAGSRVCDAPAAGNTALPALCKETCPNNVCSIPADSTYQFLSGTRVTVVANPSVVGPAADSSADFYRWFSGPCRGTGRSCTLSLSGNFVGVGAVFFSVPKLTIGKMGEGNTAIKVDDVSVRPVVTLTTCTQFPCTVNAKRGNKLQLTPVDAAGSQTRFWQGCSSLSKNICTVTMNDSRSVWALTDVMATVTLQAAGNGRGSVEVLMPSGTQNCKTFPCRMVVPNGTPLLLLATPARGSSYKAWSGCDEVVGNVLCSITTPRANSTDVVVEFTTP